MKDNAITAVFIIPIVKRNCLLSCSVISDDIRAACPDPNPGRNEAKGAVREVDIIDFRILDFSSLIFFRGVIICGGILVLFFIEIIRAESPNSPVNKGSRGCFTGRLKVRIPKSPASVNTVKDIKNSSSLKIRKRDAKIKMYGMAGFVISSIGGRR